MMKRVFNIRLAVFTCLLAVVSASPLLPGQSASTPPNANSPSQDQTLLQEEAAAVPPGNVVIDGRQVLTVYGSFAGLTPQARAQAIKARILGVAKDTVPAESIHIAPRTAWIEILSETTSLWA